MKTIMKPTALAKRMREKAMTLPIKERADLLRKARNLEIVAKLEAEKTKTSEA
jgi:hypothetical protein